MDGPARQEAALRADELTLGYGREPVVDRLTLEIPPGAVTAVVGANGCGKSTLLRGLSRLLAPRHGTVVLDGQDVHRMPARALAQRLGLLPQSPTAPDGITVRELVGRGRSPHLGLFGRPGEADRAAVDEALALTETTDLADRPVDSLSGGQRQRVWIALVLAQQTDVLLLDEPTTFLDISHQLDVLDTVHDLNRRRGTTVVMVLHDVTMAARYADHLVALVEGAVVAAGTPREVVTAPLMAQVFGLGCAVVDDPVTGTPMVVPHSRRHPG